MSLCKTHFTLHTFTGDVVSVNASVPELINVPMYASHAIHVHCSKLAENIQPAVACQNVPELSDLWPKIKSLNVDPLRYMDAFIIQGKPLFLVDQDVYNCWLLSEWYMIVMSTHYVLS